MSEEVTVIVIIMTISNSIWRVSPRRLHLVCRVCGQDLKTEKMQDSRQDPRAYALTVDLHLFETTFVLIGGFESRRMRMLFASLSNDNGWRKWWCGGEMVGEEEKG